MKKKTLLFRGVRAALVPRAVFVAVLALIALPSSFGCGGSGCLSASEVSDQVNKIASGFEYSDGEVQAKTEEIADVRARQCKA
jgi:hypothetical protein